MVSETFSIFFFRSTLPKFIVISFIPLKLFWKMTIDKKKRKKPITGFLFAVYRITLNFYLFLSIIRAI